MLADLAGARQRCDTFTTSFMSLRRALTNTHRGLSNSGGPYAPEGDVPERLQEFADRRAAARQLADHLQSYSGRTYSSSGLFAVA
jgi:hypothetical protein